MAFANFAYANYGYGLSGEDPTVAGGAGAYNPRYHFQAAQNAGFQVGSDEGQPRILYVGNLDQSVTEEFVATLFGQIGRITKTKVIFDTSSDPYAFVEFSDHHSASQALQAMNKRMLLDREMKVNWATQPGTTTKVDTSRHFHVFVGDLSPEVDNKALRDAFIPFGEVSDAKVIRDPQTTKSKGYGFVSYPKREEAERAIEQMNGQWLGRRTIRTNWATRKPTDGDTRETRGMGMPMGGGGGYGGGGYGERHPSRLSYDDIFNQTGPDNQSVYIGNVPANSTEDDVRQIFKRFGTVVDVRHFKAQGYSFVKFDAKESAAKAIHEMNGAEFMGQAIRCSWGKAEGARGGGPADPAAAAAAAAAAATAAIQAQSGAGGPPGPGGAAPPPGAPNAQQHQQFWQYYQHYYNNPAVQQQWTQYWQSTGSRPPVTGAPSSTPIGVPPTTVSAGGAPPSSGASAPSVPPPAAVPTSQ